MTVKTPVWCELVCAECATRSEGMFAYGATPRMALKKNARREGFTFYRNEVYCGQKCLTLGAAKLAKEKQP